MSATSHSASYDVVILGAGYAGLMTALRLRRRKGLRIALINMRDAFVERVRLQETIAAPIGQRLPSIADFVAATGIDFIQGTVTTIDPVQRRTCFVADGQTSEVTFGLAVYALGSTIDTEAIQGVADHAYRLEAGSGPRSASALRARLQASAGQSLRVVVVGGAETGVEVAGEIKTVWPRADVSLVSRSRCGAFKGARVEFAVRSALQKLGVRLFDGEAVQEVSASALKLGGDRSIDHDICVWSGGLRAPVIAREAGLATDLQGRIWVDAELRSISHPHIFAVGDAAHPAAPTGAPYRLSAFAALASGAHAADVILAQRAEQRFPPFSLSTFGQGIAIGRGGVGFLSYPDDRAGPQEGVMAASERRGQKTAEGAGVNLDRAFAELRPAMFGLAYRITGNRADADEIVQDAFVRLQNAGSQDAIRSLKAYLTTITARLSLNRLRDQRAHRETYFGEWLPEPLVTAEEPAARAEDVSYALMAVLERLSPQERVVYVLRNAFDFTFEEIAPVIDRDAVTCRKIFSRARARVLEERPRFTVDRERHRALLRSFAEAARGGDHAKLVALLADDAVLHGDGGGKALAIKKPVIGAAAVAQFIIAVTRTVPADTSIAEIDFNHTPGLVLITAAGQPTVAIMIDTDGECIHSVFAISNPDKLAAIPSAGLSA